MSLSKPVVVNAGFEEDVWASFGDVGGDVGAAGEPTDDHLPPSTINFDHLNLAMFEPSAVTEEDDAAGKNIN